MLKGWVLGFGFFQLAAANQDEMPVALDPKPRGNCQGLKSKGLLYGFCFEDSRTQGLIGFGTIYFFCETLRTLSRVLAFRVWDLWWQGLGFARVRGKPEPVRVNPCASVRCPQTLNAKP